MGQFGEQQSNSPASEWAYGPNENGASWVLCRCAQGSRKREEEQGGRGKQRKIGPYGVLTTVDVPQQASSFGNTSTAVSKKPCRSNTFTTSHLVQLLYTDLDHIVTVLICYQWFVCVQARLGKEKKQKKSLNPIMERKYILYFLYTSLILCWWLYWTFIAVYVIHKV